MKRNKKNDVAVIAAVERLANLIEYGQLLAATDTAGFMNAAADEIERLRSVTDADGKELSESLRRGGVERLDLHPEGWQAEGDCGLSDYFPTPIEAVRAVLAAPHPDGPEPLVRPTETAQPLTISFQSFDTPSDVIIDLGVVEGQRPDGPGPLEDFEVPLDHPSKCAVPGCRRKGAQGFAYCEAHEDDISDRCNHMSDDCTCGPDEP